MVYKTCQYCGKKLEPAPFTTHMMYCSEECRNAAKKAGIKPQFIPFAFTCAKCGKVIVIEDPDDKRTRFCSPECEKKYWRHPPYENPTSRTNFHSVEEYASWERRTNE